MTRQDTIRSVLAYLCAERDTLNTAIAALEPLVRGEDASAQAVPVKTRKVAHKAAAPATPPAAPKRRTAAHAEDGADWQAQALTALKAGPPGARVSELATRLRVPDAQRDKATQRLWTALQTLVKHGQVVREGTSYRLASQGNGREAA